MGLKLAPSPYSLDDPRTTLYHREIILSKPFLKRLYDEWYSTFVARTAEFKDGKMLEIGSGGGFLQQVIPGVITSDIQELKGVDMVFSAEKIPMEDRSLSAIFTLNVFHHIPKPAEFLKEAQRTLKKGGKLIMIEPANSFWSRIVYKNFHHEPFDPKGGWEIESTGPLSGANGALPWIYFKRDREKFEKEFPSLKLKEFRYHTPLRYLLSGGLSLKPLVPKWSFGFFRGFEKLLSPLSGVFGMFVTVEIEKI
ncbi:MAG TPA: class I SAM-dependent methyltransferase [Bacteroidia bacterium]|jgi:SAM-dependent methyltransferase|nr:class I SAM-dependent methyltransferase [Bacteroidia bacterium]